MEATCTGGKKRAPRARIAEEKRVVLTKAFGEGLNSTGKDKMKEIQDLAGQLDLDVGTVKVTETLSPSYHRI